MNVTRAHRYPVWSTRIVVLISVAVIVTITLLVFALSDRSIFVESQISLGIIALCLFAFLTIGLYRGARLERPGKDELDRSVENLEGGRGKVNPSWVDFLDALFAFGPPDVSHAQLPHFEMPHIDLGGGSDLGSGDDLLGCLGGLVLWIVVMILIVAAVWLLAQAIAVLPVIVVMLYWVFYRALRVVFARSKTCRGRLLRSTGYGLLYTILYTGWVFVLLWIGRFVLSLA